MNHKNMRKAKAIMNEKETKHQGMLEPVHLDWDKTKVRHVDNDQLYSNEGKEKPGKERKVGFRQISKSKKG